MKTVHEGSEEMVVAEAGPLAVRPTIVLLSEAAGGVMRHLIDLYHGLKSSGFTVRMILSPGRIDERYKAELAAIPSTDLQYVSMSRMPRPDDLKALFELRKILKRIEGPVVLHCHSTKAGLLGSILRRSVHGSVFTPHAYRGTDPNLKGLSRRFVEFVEWVYSKGYDFVVAEVPMEYAYGRKIGLGEKTLRLVPNGIPLQAIDFDNIAAQRSHRSSPPTLGFVGRLVYQKNPTLFLEVMHELSKLGCQTKAILLGEGSLRAEMDEVAARYGLTDSLDWRGEVPASAVYPEMDVMVHTSLYEALPYSLIEACAALLPVVATVNPGSQAIFGAKLPDSLAPQQDAAALAQKVLRLLTEPDFYQAQMETLREIALTFSTEAMVDSYVALYSQLM